MRILLVRHGRYRWQLLHGATAKQYIFQATKSYDECTVLLNSLLHAVHSSGVLNAWVPKWSESFDDNEDSLKFIESSPNQVKEIQKLLYRISACVLIYTIYKYLNT